jgi:hypothetical protein
VKWLLCGLIPDNRISDTARRDLVLVQLDGLSEGINALMANVSHFARASNKSAGFSRTIGDADLIWHVVSKRRGRRFAIFRPHRF